MFDQSALHASRMLHYYTMYNDGSCDRGADGHDNDVEVIRADIHEPAEVDPDNDSDVEQEFDAISFVLRNLQHPPL